MNFVTLVVGLLLIGIGFVALVRKVHDRSLHQALAVLRDAPGDMAPAISAFVGLLVPIVSSIAGGVAFLAVGLLGHSLTALSWLGL